MRGLMPLRVLCAMMVGWASAARDVSLSAVTHPVASLSRATHRDRWDVNWFCDKDQDCNQLGRCDVISGMCQCDPTYHGQRCEYKRCPVSTLNELECSGHGACIASNAKAHTLPLVHTVAGESLTHGTCSCEVGYTGPACETRECPSDCLGEGVCASKTSEFGKLLTFDSQHHSSCQCNSRAFGLSCQFRRCPISPRGYECDTDSSHKTETHGECDRFTGTCICSPGSYGASCELRLCPGETRTVSVGKRRTEEFDFQNQRYAPLNTDKGHATYNNPSNSHELASATATDGKVVVDVEAGNVGGDETMTHSGVRRHGNAFSVKYSYDATANAAGKEWPVNIYPIDTTKSCTQQGVCNPQKGECRCFEAFFGADCSLRHCPNSTRGFVCDGAGTCDHDSGQCACTTVETADFETVNAYGPDCSLRTCPLVNGLECDGEGACDKNTGLCACNVGRFGADCSSRTCPVSRVTKLVCDGHGDCHGGSGLCKCHDGFFGVDCSLAVCPRHHGQMCNMEGTCVNEGTMAAVGTCKCNDGFYGDACQYHNCPHSGNNEECSGNGNCDATSGRCDCNAGFYGKDCGYKKCPEYNGRSCNLNGKCVKEVHNRQDGIDSGDNIGNDDLGDASGRDVTNGLLLKQSWSGGAHGQCVCNSGFYGDACQFRTCPRSERNQECNGHGTCQTETGYCVCAHGFYGADCSIGTCPAENGIACNGQGECRKAGTIGETYSTSDHKNSVHIYVSEYAEPDTTVDRSDAELSYCVCKHPHFGSSCEKKHCPMSTANQLECDGAGTCDTTIGVCKCDELRYGKDCSLKRCPEHNGRVCNLQGHCTTGDMVRESAWRRTDTMSSVAFSGFSGNKVGECKCNFPYYGDKCQYKRCPIAWPSNTVTMTGGVGGDEGHGDEISNDHDRGLDFLKPTETCGKFGLCDKNTGKCKCQDGYSGESCQLKECPQVNGRVCNNQGTCNKESHVEDKMGTCTCTFPFYGVTCEYKRCPTSSARPANIPWGVAGSEQIGWQVSKEAVEVWGKECDGHGACNHHSGQCECDTWWSGESCQKKRCPLVNGFECNKHGKCVTGDQADDNIGTCSCQAPYFGVDCSKKRCPSSSSNHGDSWHGMNRNQECDGHGECNYDTGVCNCDNGYSGLDCATRRNLCPLANKNADTKYKVCNGEGACNTDTGLCQCYSEEFSGLDCSHRRCPFYPDINGLECNGHGECVQGYDERGQWTGICQCESQWSGKMCQENYIAATPAASTPPPRYFDLGPAEPGTDEHITDPRRHIILGSEGRDFYDENSSPSDGDSYQSPDTRIRAENYIGGQHPTNQDCTSVETTSDMKAKWGCQHSVTHPEPYTGKPKAQPSEFSSYDKIGSHTNRLTLGQEQPTGFVSFNSGH